MKQDGLTKRPGEDTLNIGLTGKWLGQKEEKMGPEQTGVNPETNRILAQCLFGEFLISRGGVLQVACLENSARAMGMKLLREVLEDPRLHFLADEDWGVPDRGYSQLVAIRDQCLNGEEVTQETFIQRFSERMLDGRLAKIDGLMQFANDPGGVELIKRQLLRFQVPMIVFLCCLAVQVITRLEEEWLLARNEQGLFFRTN